MEAGKTLLVAAATSSGIPSPRGHSCSGSCAMAAGLIAAARVPTLVTVGAVSTFAASATVSSFSADRVPSAAVLGAGGTCTTEEKAPADG